MLGELETLKAGGYQMEAVVGSCTIARSERERDWEKYMNAAFSFADKKLEKVKWKNLFQLEKLNC